MWLITEYRPASLFSLKVGLATSTGAKTLFLPTPMAIRNAFLDTAIRTQGLGSAGGTFKVLKSLRIAASPPERVIITNMFTKVQKPKRGDKSADTEDEEEETNRKSAMQKSIAFREYAYLDGILALAFEDEMNVLNLMEELAPRINYFGKRGSFFQWIDCIHHEKDLPANFTRLDEGMDFENEKMTGNIPTSFPLGVIQLMDDWGDALTWDKVNVYSDARITVPKDRIRRSVIFPYRLICSSRGFSYYEWQRK